MYRLWVMVWHAKFLVEKAAAAWGMGKNQTRLRKEGEKRRVGL